MNLGKRIMVMGCSGSGKSTLARQLGKQLNLPVVHGDKLCWQPGWVFTPKDEMTQAFHAAAAQPAWVIDGDYRACAFEYRFERADTVIFLDISPFVCLWRALKRRAGKSPRPDMGEGYKNTLRGFRLKNIFGYAKQSHIAWLAGIQPHRQVYHLKGRRAVKRFMSQLPAPTQYTPASTGR